MSRLAGAIATAVTSRPETEAASYRAVHTTLVGSTIPAFSLPGIRDAHASATPPPLAIPSSTAARGVMAAPNAILEVRSSVTYSSQMTEVRQTPIFRKWLDNLADRRAAERIVQRIVRLQSGLIGDAKPVGRGISELRVDYGPGYRVYFTQRGAVLIILLCGGDKRSQSRDIVRARALADELEDD